MAEWRGRGIRPTAAGSQCFGYQTASGVQWIQTDLQDKTGERITAHYSKNGCYYMKLNEDLSGRIENAQPIIDGVGTKTLQWSVFLDISKEP